MAMSSLSDGQLRSMRLEQGLDHFAREILLKGLGRPWRLYAPHAAIFAANYGGFLAVFWRDLLRLLPGRGRGASSGEGEEHERRVKRRRLASLLFTKFLVWQHLAEAIGCRQGPIGGHFGLPNNWKFRLSLGTIKYPLLSVLGKKRNILDLLVHSLFFVTGIAFLGAKEYKLKYIRALCACDVWIFLSDLSQFFASTGHAYFSMLLSACFSEDAGRLAGIQSALLIQWFFSGIGKVGPWFGYVNAPFMLQSKAFAGHRWLFNLLVRSPADLGPTTFGAVFGHACAAVEYLAPLALLIPRKLRRMALPPPPPPPASEKGSALAETKDAASESALVPAPSKRDVAIGLGLAGIAGMHAYILTMPAPFDVYSWNMSFGLSAIYLFYYAGFGFDHAGARSMNRGLAAFLAGEFALCWYGQFFPDQVGYYLSHRYWAGNWVQTLFFVRRSAASKLARVKTCSAEPLVWGSLQPLGLTMGLTNFAYLWLSNLNMKAALGLIREGVRLAGGAGADVSDYVQVGLTQLCCGEFRDALYALPLLPTIQEEIGFEAGECFMLRLGAFGLCQDSATWGIYDLKGGLLKGGLLSLSALSKMDSFPSQSIGALGG